MREKMTISSKDKKRDELAMHRAVFDKDVQTLSSLIREGRDLGHRDIHGNTPLHVAVMMGHKECIAMLLAHNAPVKIKNIDGWNPLAESISYGDRQTIVSMLRKLKLQSRDNIKNRKPHLLKVLSSLGDFYMELKWDFHSWIPLISKMLPSDVCKIYKKGTSIRMDTTLVDFNERTWERGDISFIFDSTEVEKGGDPLVVLDNKAKVYQRIKYEETDAELEDEVDMLMSSDIVNAQMSTKTITFHRVISGWFFKQEKTEQIGEYSSDYYSVEGLYLDSKKRREHLTTEDVKKNKAIIQNLSMGTISDEDWKIQQHRKSLAPPPRSVLGWDEYVGSLSGDPPCLGRPQNLKQSKKHFKATVAMSEEFPLTVEVLLDILEIVAPFKHLQKLRHFCKVRLPPGFPVRIEIPLLPTISAKVTFQKFVFRKDLSESLFRIPKNFREDSNRFPDL